MNPTTPTGRASGLRWIRAHEAWQRTIGEPTVNVAVLDTGVNVSHPDLQRAVASGWNALDGSDDVADAHGHGTSVAGVVAARTNNGVGVASYCWRCTIIPVKVLDDDGRGTASAVAAGIVWATDHGADVVNLSLGAAHGTRALESAVEYAREHDVVVVAAAGNDGSTDVRYPAAYEQAIGVTATDADDDRYGWSNYGPLSYVAAPGCNVAPAVRTATPTSVARRRRVQWWRGSWR